MGILDRMNRVIKSNLNALVDQAEDPEKLIAQTIVDMEREVKTAQGEIVTTLGTAKRLLQKAKESQAEVASWEDRAVLALREGDEDLAREALKRKAIAQADAHEHKLHAAQAESSAAKMKDTLESVKSKIEELKARKGTLAAGVRRARQAGSAGSSRYGSSTFDDLDRMTSRIDQLEAEVEVHDVLEDPRRLDVDARFRELEKKAGLSGVDDELASLKAKLKND
ncbi:MAG: PspA/IM30 family protein [Myxococcales bacterium]|nr:PspA/IM30 family protein [Myxococcales bacterium]